MAILAAGLRHLRCQGQLKMASWQPAASLTRSNVPPGARALNTAPSDRQPASGTAEPGSGALIDTAKLPYRGVTHARTVPSTPSYFSREPQFNDMYIRISDLLTKYRHLPTLAPSDMPPTPWVKLDHIRAQTGERVKMSHYGEVLKLAKRLNLIEPTLKPPEVIQVLQRFKRDINPLLNRPKPTEIDRFGRAVGVGKRKASTARAFVVEGTGEIQINGKLLNQVFGRIHDRESAVWALKATERLDKYNVWVLVEGGGTTGQAEAVTLAVAKALLVHEPALKPILRKAGCVTRDPRTVERKKHGHLKARKSPAWVKR